MNVRVSIRVPLVLAVVFASGLAWTLCERSAVGREIGLTTAYQTEPITLTIDGEQRQFRCVNLRVNLNQHVGVLQLDATTCSQVDPFGEVAGCSPGIYPPEKIRLAQVRLADPAGHGRNLYAILESSPEERLFLVVPTRACDSYRLSVEDDGRVTRVITMEFDESMCVPLSPGTSQVQQRRLLSGARVRAACRRLAR